jgi:hypothetical protein
LVLQLKAGCMSVKERPSPTSNGRCRPLNRTWAEQILKDPYNFDSLTVTAEAKEREIERGC